MFRLFSRLSRSYELVAYHMCTVWHKDFKHFYMTKIYKAGGISVFITFKIEAVKCICHEYISGTDWSYGGAECGWFHWSCEGLWFNITARPVVYNYIVTHKETGQWQSRSSLKYLLLPRTQPCHQWALSSSDHTVMLPTNQFETMKIITIQSLNNRHYVPVTKEADYANDITFSLAASAY